MAKAGKDRRGGRRQRHFAAKCLPSAIDYDAISRLLEILAPQVSDARHAIALAIVVKGIELIREHAPIGPALPPGAAQENRRALAKLKVGKTELGVPFNSFARLNGRLYAAGNSGIYEIEDLSAERIEVDELGEKILSPLRTMGLLEQRLAGLHNINPNVLHNPLVDVRGTEEGEGSERTMADNLLDHLVHPRAWDEELAGYVYFAIQRGLAIKAVTSWYVDEPEQMKTGWNFGRLLKLTADQVGLQLPSTRSGMEKLLKRGKAWALEPAITYPDGRSFTALEIEFPEV